MSRIRSIHPGLFTDEDFVELSDGAQIFYIGLLCEADDRGVFVWKPNTLKMRLRPVSLVSVDGLLDELVTHRKIKQFQGEGGRVYGAIRNFRQYQRPQRPSAVHPLPDSLLRYVGLGGHNRGMDADSDGVIHGIEDAGDPNILGIEGPATLAVPGTHATGPTAFQSSSGIQLQRKEEGDKRKEERDSSENPVEGEKASRTATARPRPDIPQAFDAYNALATRLSLPIAAKLTEQRKRALRARLDEHGLDGWAKALAKVEASPYLRGEVKDWRADLDFLLQASKLVQVIEGRYDRRNGVAPQSAAAESSQRRPGGPVRMIVDDAAHELDDLAERQRAQARKGPI